MYWTPPCTRHWTKTGKKQTNTTQYVMDTTMHKTVDEDRTKQKNTTQYALDTTMHKTLDEDRKKQTNTTQYVLDTTMHKTLDEDRKKTNKHNTICDRHHFTQTNTNNVNKTTALLQITGGKDELKTVLCGYRNGHHNTELRT